VKAVRSLPLPLRNTRPLSRPPSLATPATRVRSVACKEPLQQTHRQSARHTQLAVSMLMRMGVGVGAEVEGLQRKLVNKLSPVGGEAADWEISECAGVWWRPNFDNLFYPYLPPHITRPKVFLSVLHTRDSPSRLGFRIVS
jgi:hypothetical protein